MTYIIDPMWFYWVSVVDVVKVCSGFIAGIALFILITAGSCSDMLSKHTTRWLFVALVVGGALAVFVPSEVTLTKMLLAKFATYENAEIALDGIQSAADYIVNAIKEIR